MIDGPNVVIYIDMVAGLPSLFVRFLPENENNRRYPVKYRQDELIEYEFRSIFC